MTPPLPPPPEPPAVLSVEEVLASDQVRVPVASWRWHRLRDAYADQQAAYIDELVGRYKLAQADLVDVRLDLVVSEGARVDCELRLADVQAGPGWGLVAGAGAGGLVLGGALVVVGLLAVR